ncbi:2-carboxy-1,4-naphthoquinone phytyltransferase [filamentous cyanobacterium LEGE 11480]|uniref:2-carboxy-1,4-naphthoquinone phytyltransferase n=2 Tax=Romeriopsis TaxID=2992131 RepID=A0A928VKJ8_9CYAN|nr:2-carboxy-1,4-naphthoquinone phytyltransferase [Romeriopsis navalis LEGE 11480]
MPGLEHSEIDQSEHPQPVTAEAADRQLWWAAIKPPMYSVAIMPIWIGSTLAFWQRNAANPLIFFLFLGSAVLILAWENLSNDVFDADTGVDVHKRNSLVNMTGQKSLIFWIANGLLAAGLVGIAAIAALQQDLMVVWLVLGCCAIGYIYQGPPFRLSYKGVGELLCLIAFGPLACSAAYYSQTQSWSWNNLFASLIVGLATSLILFSSHFNQIKDDLAVGKLSPVVRLGGQRAAKLLPWLCGLVYALLTIGVMTKLFPAWTILGLLSCPVAQRLCETVGRDYQQPEKLLKCRLIAVEMHFWLGLFFGLGFLLPG